MTQKNAGIHSTLLDFQQSQTLNALLWAAAEVIMHNIT